MNIRVKPPCYQCTDRHTACHATCAAYREWAAARSRTRENRWNDARGGREAESLLIDHRIADRKRKERY